MNARSLNLIVVEALAEIGLDPHGCKKPKGRQRTTTWLGDEPGFGIRQYPGDHAVYFVQARMGGRNRTVTIGRTAVLTRHQAAKVARMVLAYARVGDDPATKRARVRGAPMYADFLDEFWAKWAVRWSPETQRNNAGKRRCYLDGAFPGLGIDEIGEAHVTAWFAHLNDETTPGAANMALGLLSLILNKAIAWGYRHDQSNPCTGVRRNKRKKCERFLSVPELQRLGAVIAQERQSADRIRSMAAIATTLLLLTGCRRGEILGLQWNDIKGSRIKLRHGKTGPRTVWLGEDARAVIDTIPRRRGVEWLFWDGDEGAPIRSFARHWYAMQEMAGLSRLRLHDLRHTFASHAAMNRETLPMIGKLLGHRIMQTTARYTHLDDGHVFDAVEQVGAEIARMTGLGV